MNPIAKTLILLGSILILTGLIWQFGGRFFSLGKLPGDLTIERENFKFYFPITTSIVLSILFSLVSYVIRKINP